MQTGSNARERAAGFKYPFTVWLITVLGAPFVLVIAEGIYNDARWADFFSSAPLFFIIMVVGAVVSIPSLFLFWLVNTRIKLMAIAAWQQKALLSLIGISFIFLSFFLIDRGFLLRGDIGQFLWPASYALVLVAAIFLVKIKTAVQEELY